MPQGLDRLLVRSGPRVKVRIALAAAVASFLSVPSPANVQSPNDFPFTQHITYERGQENEVCGTAVFTMMDPGLAEGAIQRNAAAGINASGGVSSNPQRAPVEPPLRLHRNSLPPQPTGANPIS